MKTQKGNIKEKLTPVYVVLVIMNGRRWQHDAIYNKYKGMCPRELSEKDARATVERLERDGNPAMAYQYGWKQRGFQIHEDGYLEPPFLCKNALWQDDHYHAPL